MSPLLIVYGLLLFALCLIAHVLHWRWRKPRNEPAALVANFLVAPLLTLLVLYLATTITLGESLCLYLFHFALAGVYLSSFPAVQAYSPSLEILLLYRGRKFTGFTRVEILRTFDQSAIVSDRVKDLKSSRLIVEQAGKYRLSFIACAIILAYTAYRSILGLPLKGR